MFLYPIYKAIKTRLTTITSPSGVVGGIPIFFFIGQYKKGKDNTSYAVPAIYIEMPKDTGLNFYPKNLMSAKAPIKIHYISYAPFKNHDNTAQEAAIEAHEQKLRDIDTLLTGWNVTDVTALKLTEQLIPGNANLLDFEDMTVTSIISYNTEIYSRHLMTSSLKA